MLHSVAAFYFICMAFVCAVIPIDQATVLWLWSRPASCVASIFLGLIHVYGFFEIIRPRRARPKRIHVSTVQLSTRVAPVWATCLVQRWMSLFGRYGYFGLYGPHYELRLMTKILLQLPLQAYRAYVIGVLLTSPGSSALFSSCFVGSCVAQAVAIYASQRSVRRWCGAVADVIFSFVMSIGIPVVLVGRAVIELFIAGKNTLLYDHTWLNKGIMVTRYIVNTSFWDFILKLVLNGACIFALLTFSSAIQVPVGTSALLQPRSFELARKPFAIVLLTAALVITVLASASLRPRDCPPGCRLQSYPWFTLQCNCLMYTLNCDEWPVADVDAFVAASLPHVFDLTITRCNLPHGLAPSAVAGLVNLYALQLDSTGTVDWQLPALPLNVLSLVLSNIPLAGIPRMLGPDAMHLNYLYLRNVSLTTNKSLPEWNSLFMLDISGAGVNPMPDFVARLPLSELGWSSNGLTTLPMDVPAMPSLRKFRCFNNTITHLPDDWSRLASTIQHVYLNGNPLMDLPPSLPFSLLNTSRVVIRDTRYCNELLVKAAEAAAPVWTPMEAQILTNLEVICGHDCGVGCIPELLGNTQCDPQCNVPAYHAKVLFIWSRSACASACFILAALHFLGITFVLARPRPSARIAPGPSVNDVNPMQAQTPSWSLYGFFGLYGPYYELRLVLKQSVQIPLQAYRAYELSRLLTNQWYSLLFGLVLAGNCIALPLCLSVRRRHTRRWSGAIVDALFGFCMSIGLPLATVLGAIIDMYFRTDRRQLLSDRIWLNSSILLARFLVIDSAEDALILLVLQCTFWLSLYTLSAGIRVERGHEKRRSTVSFRSSHNTTSTRSSQSRFSLPSSLVLQLLPEAQRQLAAIRHTSFWRPLALVSYAIAGIVLSVVAASFVRETCHPGCHLQSYPWFTSHCSCIMYTLDCKALGVTDVDEFIALHLTNVFDLTLARCPLPEGLNASTLARLTSIYSLQMSETQTARWDLSPDALPRSLFALYLQSVPLTAIPTILHDLPPNLLYLFLRGVSLSDNKTLPAWSGLTILEITGAGLTEIPAEVLRQPLTHLSWDDNALTELPTALLVSSTLHSVSCINNAITTVPLFAWPASLQQLLLNGNPLSELPATLPFQWINKAKIVIRDTPYCNNLLVSTPADNWTSLDHLIHANVGSICSNDCGVGCTIDRVGDGNCDLQCNVSKCYFDSGDCDP
ncbi:hypothetical protein ACHHYP_10730 [Achlya hypogyna]|uniref:LNR domain-containing protein n=1 Tax=Achlya hypogyna TaxID=1202772 RepID=A0A1V9ZHR5_ACHHY|nr:hypothetical protein ACHHYP_10730 [Achlya hypogyna]